MSTKQDTPKIASKRNLSESVEASVQGNDVISQTDNKRSRVETSTTSSSDLYLDTVR